MTAHDEAVQAAAKALAARCVGLAGCEWERHAGEAMVAVAAAAPFLRADGAAAERQRIAEAIRAEARMHAYIVGETADAPATNNPEQRARDHGIQIAYDSAALIAEEDES